jgi:hypothetical protein
MVHALDTAATELAVERPATAATGLGKKTWRKNEWFNMV